MNRKRLKCLKCLSALVSTFLLSQCVIEAHAANTYIPELNVYQQGSSPKIEVALDIAPEDVILKFGFNTNDSISWRNCQEAANGNGGLTDTTEDKYEGDRALKLVDTLTNHTGNYYWPPMTQADTSNWNTQTLYLNNDSVLALSYKYKMKSGTIGGIGPYMNTGLDDRGQCYDPMLNKWEDADSSYTLLFDQDVDFRNGFPDKIKVKAKGGRLTEVASNRMLGNCWIVNNKKNDRSWGHAEYYLNVDTQELELFQVKNGNRTQAIKFNKGEPILCGRDRNVGIASRWIETADNKWHTNSATAKLTLPYYNFQEMGTDLRCGMRTDGVLYIDDIKFGFASQIQLQRNGAVISTDYDYDIVDSGVVITPNKAVVSKAVTNPNNVQFTFKAAKKTETYKYKARSKSNSSGTWSSWSREFPVTLVSTPKGYSVKVDKKATTDPGKTMNNTNGTISATGYKEGDEVYLHVRTVDTNNQWSDPIHYKYIVKQTAMDLKEDVSVYAKKLSVDNATDINSIKAQITKLRTNNNIPYNITKMNKSNATKYNKGKIEFTTSINGQSQSSTTPIESKPVYQTEQELKEDITDYIGQTSIHNNNKQIPETLSYDKSKNIDEIKQDIISKCKTNPDLKDVSIEFTNSATEFSSGELEGKIYLED